jgi:hypothetical protein
MEKLWSVSGMELIGKFEYICGRAAAWEYGYTATISPASINFVVAPE